MQALVTHARRGYVTIQDQQQGLLAMYGRAPSLHSVHSERSVHSECRPGWPAKLLGLTLAAAPCKATLPHILQAFTKAE